MDSLNIKGIDISNWQGNINLQEVSNAGVKIVYIKVTEGLGYIDPMFLNYYKEAKEAKLKIGFYHFLHPNEDAVEQAMFMYKQIKNLSYDCKIAIDIEVTNNESCDIINECIIQFANKLKELTDEKVIVYTDLNFANTIFNSSIANLEFWQAEYGVTSPTTSNVFGNNIIGWQYSDNGSFTCATDLDLFSEKIYINSKPKKNIFVVGEKVEISESAINYFTGQIIPQWVKQGIYTIEQIGNDKALLQELQSWVYLSELLKVELFDIGDKVKLIPSSSTYVTGQTIPAWVKNNIYTVEEININEALLQEIQSWVYLNELLKVKSFAVGDKVKLISSSSTYVTGQIIPTWVKNNIYTIEEISTDKVLLQEIQSWVYENEIVLY